MPHDAEKTDAFADGQLMNAEGEAPLCFIVDDEEGIRRFLALDLSNRGIETKEFHDANGLLQSAAERQPQLIFLDVALESSDAVEAIRGLVRLQYKGAVQLISGRGGSILQDVRKIGERHGLKMLPVMEKPLRIQAIGRIVEENCPRGGGQAATVTLATALRNNWITAWYQPKFGLKDRSIIGVEALARIEHPQQGVLTPAHFLPQADNADVCRLTEHMLIAALRDWGELQAQGFPLKLSVNASIDVLLELPIATLVREHRPRTSPPQELLLEVKEDQVIRDMKRAHEIATQLRIYDIGISIDDFGAGYSSLSRLKELPFVELKLDIEYVRNCATDSMNAAICQTVIDLAHRFGSTASGEGIERAADLNALFRMGCDAGQGFLLARPMPKHQLLALLTRSEREKQGMLGGLTGPTLQKPRPEITLIPDPARQQS
jgi:EAL domain-containing protein (putative c-di-GMP-specific phosphodiesterase class I)